MTIYTSKKTGARFTNLTQIDTNKFQLTSVEDPTDSIIVTESTLKRWYKKTVEVDFTNAEEKPEDKKTEAKKAPKSKKQSKPRAKTYEEQKWGLGHQRISVATFCKTLDLSSLEYNEKSQTVTLFNGSEPCARRRAWPNELTGSVWFRFHNYEYELTDVEYING